MSYIGELGWELHVGADHAAALFGALERAGQPYGIGLYGAYAANAMRLEKGYRGWGSDLTTERSPIEAGLGQFVRHAGRGFIGKEAMLARRNPWEMVLLEISAPDVDPFYAHSVIKDGAPVGIVTSGAYGHRTGKTLALAYLRDPGARDGLSVRILGRDYSATILDAAPYDAGNARTTA